MEDAKLTAFKFDCPMLLGFLPQAGGITQAGPVSAQGIFMDRPGHLERLSLEAQVAAHDADTVITVAGKIVEGGMDAAKQAGGQQFELDLLQGPAMELLGNLYFETSLDCGPDNGVSLTQLVIYRCFQQ